MFIFVLFVHVLCNKKLNSVIMHLYILFFVLKKSDFCEFALDDQDIVIVSDS